ncbi:MAG: MFS transporter [Acidobacteria bacterium]|nr:MAG: MFS transporter [Acidobacteriota bacterium]REJ99180.1 MAG: MFS transporter [Acidobacteriota bacterium]REK16099.1 MAG: MFS transporter [Acidobacteriota bacterium]REK43780.1 MAG: MFS transporter [Acidobacteriota bacterium]
MLGKARPFFLRFKGLSRNVLALSAVSLLNDTSSEMIYPLLPAFLAVTLGATPFAIGLIEGFAESLASLLKLFSGYLSDRLDKRKLPVFAGYALASVVRPLLAFVVNWQQVLAVRVVDRVGKGIRVAPRDALLAGSVEPGKRGLAFGFNRAADHLGAVIGPAIAFVILYLFAADASAPTADDYREVFLFAAVPVALGLFVIIFFVRDEDASFNNAPVKAEPLHLTLKGFDSNFVRFLIIIALFTLSNSTDAFLLLRAGQAGISLQLLPLLWMALHISKVVSSLVFGDLSDRIGRRKLIFAGWIVYAAVYCGFAFVSGPWQALVLFILYGFYFGLTEGVEKALVADLVPEEKRGTAYGLYNLAFGITVFPASLLFGYLWTTFDSSTAFLVSASVSVAAALLLLTIKNPRFGK